MCGLAFAPAFLRANGSPRSFAMAFELWFANASDRRFCDLKCPKMGCPSSRVRAECNIFV